MFGHGLDCFDSCAIWSQVGSYSYGRVAAQGVTNTSLLLSKEFLKQLGTNMDLSKGEVWFSNLGIRIRMGITSRGYFVIPIVGNHDDKIMNNDVDTIHMKYMCTYETLHTEEQRAKRAVTS